MLITLAVVYVAIGLLLTWAGMTFDQQMNGEDPVPTWLIVLAGVLLSLFWPLVLLAVAIGEGLKACRRAGE